nr:FtsQ-type POTRA domain-containing protein [Prochlorococcus marinus]
MSLKKFKKVNVDDIRISGSTLFSENDVVSNSSFTFPIRLIFIKTNLLEKDLKQNLSLKNVSVSRQIVPFGLKVHVKTRTPVAYAERILNNEEKILGFIDKDGIFIDKQNADKKNLNKLTIQVFGWKEKFKKILSEILIAQENYEFEVIKIIFSPNGFLTVEEKDLKTIFLGFKPNLINYQLQIINNLKNEFKKNNFSEEIDNIDLTDPNKPKIKVFKP